ncbi:MAG: hypothetical protein ACKOXK_10400 [Chakrabartia sp.]
MDWETASIWVAVGSAFWGLSRILDEFKRLNAAQKEVNERLAGLYRLIEEKDTGWNDRRAIRKELGHVNDKLHELNRHFDKGR